MEVIYKITNKIDGKFYIGKTKDINKRWVQHLSKVGKKRHPLYDSILHYGKENFIIEVVDKADSHLINELEKEWIKKTNAIELGYNLTEGGTGGDTFTHLNNDEKELKRLKHSNAAKIINAKNIELHRKNTKKLWENVNYRNNIIEHINKNKNIVSEKNKEIIKKLWLNKSYRQKVIEGIKKYHNNPNNRLKMSDSMKKTLSNPELLKKWSECKKGSKNGRWIGYVVVTDLNGNETRYESAVDAAKLLKVAPQKLREHCLNNTTYKVGIYKNWKFRYEIN